MKALTQEDIILLNIISSYLKNPNEVTSPYGTSDLVFRMDSRTPAQKMRDESNRMEEKEKNIIEFKELIKKLNI